MRFTKITAKTLVTLTASSALLAMLSGCGHIGKALATSEAMLDKAEFATGVDRSQLSVIEGSVTGSMDSVEYRVRTRSGQIFRCHYATAIAIQSDAVCTPVDKTGRQMQEQKQRTIRNGRCNALLHAAGRC